MSGGSVITRYFRSGRFLTSSLSHRLPSANLLPIPAGKHRIFLGNAVYVWHPAPHVASVVDVWVIPADVIAHDDKDVRLLSRGWRRRLRAARRDKNADQREAEHGGDEFCFHGVS